MDPLTQASIGSALAGAFAAKKNLKYAFAIGALAGMAPDLDILIRSENDPLVGLHFHRHFTHSLFFIPIGSFFCSLIFFFLYFKKRELLSFKEIYFFSFLGYLTHGLLDACTGYGTSLLWPFSNFRVSFNIISIVDPIYTLSLALSIWLTIRKSNLKFVRIGLLFSTLYLLFGFYQRNQALDFIKEHAREIGHKEVSMLTARPSLGNLILWRTIYLHQESFYVNAIWTAPGFEKRLYSGENVKRFNLDDYPEISKNLSLKEKISDFSFFSDHYLSFHPEKQDVIGDLRYAMLPSAITPLWGLKVDLDGLDDKVDFINFRDSSKKVRNRFLEMLKKE